MKGTLILTYTNDFGTTSNVQQLWYIQSEQSALLLPGLVHEPEVSLSRLCLVDEHQPGTGRTGRSCRKSAVQLRRCALPLAQVSLRSLALSTLEGNFPYWLGVDDRTIADEFFRPSYTTGIWGTGEIAKGLTYNVMLGNNMSQPRCECRTAEQESGSRCRRPWWYGCLPLREFDSNTADTATSEYHDKHRDPNRVPFQPQRRGRAEPAKYRLI